MEKLLLLFPLFTALMRKAPSMLQLCAATTRPPCHSPLRSELMGRPQTGKTDGETGQMLVRAKGSSFLNAVLRSPQLVLKRKVKEKQLLSVCMYVYV